MIYIKGEGWHDVGGSPYSGSNPNIQAVNDLPGQFYPSLIWEVRKLTSRVWKGFLEVVKWEVNKFNQRVLFADRKGYAVHRVLAVDKRTGSLLLKTSLSGGCLLCCFLFASSFDIIFSATSMHSTTLSVLGYICELKSGYFMVATSFTNSRGGAYFSVALYLLIYWSLLSYPKWDWSHCLWFVG